MPDISRYLDLRIIEAKTRLDAIKELVVHSGTKGNVAESVFRDVLFAFLPTICSLSNGFVVGMQNGAYAISKQIDILLFNIDQSIPIYKDKDLAVVTAGMVRLAIECKLVMNKSQLRDAITNLATVKEFNRDITTLIWAYHGLTFPTIRSHIYTMLGALDYNLWPDQIFNLNRKYVISRPKIRPAGYVWTVMHGASIIAKSLFQTILFSARVNNLTPFISTIIADRTETF